MKFELGVENWLRFSMSKSIDGGIGWRQNEDVFSVQRKPRVESRKKKGPNYDPSPFYDSLTLPDWCLLPTWLIFRIVLSETDAPIYAGVNCYSTAVGQELLRASSRKLGNICALECEFRLAVVASFLSMFFSLWDWACLRLNINPESELRGFWWVTSSFPSAALRLNFLFPRWRLYLE